MSCYQNSVSTISSPVPPRSCYDKSNRQRHPQPGSSLAAPPPPWPLPVFSWLRTTTPQTLQLLPAEALIQQSSATLYSHLLLRSSCIFPAPLLPSLLLSGTTVLFINQMSAICPGRSQPDWFLCLPATFVMTSCQLPPRRIYYQRSIQRINLPPQTCSTLFSFGSNNAYTCRSISPIPY